MAKVSKHAEEIIRLTNVGVTLKGIADRLGCSSAAVSLVLKNLGLTPLDTRRSFMEDIYESLTDPQKEYLMDQVETHMNVKQYIRSLLIKDFMQRGTKA